MTEDKFIKLFKRHIFENHETQSNAAKYWGVSNNFVSMVANGKKPPNKQMLNDLGLTMETTKTIVRRYYKK